MAIRNDFTILWGLSPRIIYVDAPSVEVGMQDLLDTLRFMEAEPSAMEDASIVSASGKEPLDDAGLKVGLTVELKNAVLAFEARSGPEYIQCTISGGNLVAKDINGDNISPTHPTAFTQIVRASSSSATLQVISTGSGLSPEQDATLTAIHDYSAHIPYLEHSVWVDTELVINGDGSQHAPFNNVTSAIDFAEANNVKQLLVTSDLTIDRQIKNFVIRGIGTPTIDCNGQNLDRSEISHCTVTGLYTGRLIIQESNLVGVLTLNGFFENCAISTASLVLLDGGAAFIKNCSAFVEGQVLPTFDIAGVSGTAALIMTGYDGGLKIINATQLTDDIKILLGTGRVVIDSSCVAGNINVGGITHLVDNSSGSNVFSETLDPHHLTDVYKSAFNKRVWNKVDTLTLYEDDKITPLQVYDTDNELSVVDPQ